MRFTVVPSPAMPSRSITTISTPGPAVSDKLSRMLRNHAGDRGVVLRFDKDQLPAFTLWKNTGGLRDGYVTGLEPGTNYPNPRPFERRTDRVVTLPVDGRYLVDDDLGGARHVRGGRRGGS